MPEEVVNTNIPNPPPLSPDIQGVPAAVTPEPTKNYTPLVIVGIIIAVLLIVILGLVISFVYFQPKKTVIVTPPPPETPVATTSPTSSSPFATDSALLDLKSQLQSLNAQLDSVDFTESQVAPPVVDLNIQIKAN